MVVNEVEAVKPPHDLPKLPVARTMWRPLPDFKGACKSWILSGGAHHTCFSQNLNAQVLEDFCEMAQIECVLINKQTNIKSFNTYLKSFD